MFSMAHEYALRSTVYLASRYDEGPIDHGQISDATQVPAAYLSKILQTLVKQEILLSKRGALGGFWLARKPQEMSVLEVMEAVDPLDRIESCPLNLKSHATTLCPMHAKLAAAQAEMETTFRESTLHDMLLQAGHPKPLVESLPAPFPTGTVAECKPEDCPAKSSEPIVSLDSANSSTT